jgi:TPP-dependent indolepyruvate ferredoxin oxidoreductase alpha subunit
LLIIVGQFDRADFRAAPAIDTALDVHVARLLAQRYGEIARLAFDGPAVIITNRPCMLFPRKVPGDGRYEVDEDLCTACQQCMKLGCPSMHHTEAEFKGRYKVAIDPETCTGCSLCAQLCKPGAITKAGAE